MSTAAALFFKNKKEILSKNKEFHTSGTAGDSGNGSGGEGKVRFHIAVEGCAHGALDAIYAQCRAHEAADPQRNRIDLLVCCGDFQALRGPGDLRSMAVPAKYRELGDFAHYASAGAPIPTLFIGGNHENSDWLAECSYGEFLAPGIYYLGHSGVVDIVKRDAGSGEGGGEGRGRRGVLRLAGLSGIFKTFDYRQPYPPRPYYSHNAVKSAYHVREIEMEKLRCYTEAVQALRGASGGAGAEAAGAGARRRCCRPVDVFLSHDWPAGVTAYGDEAALLRVKPFFREDVRHHRLGNMLALSMLLRASRPRYWLSAHLHVHFTATIPHDAENAGGPRVLAGSGEAPPGGGGYPSTTFLALDKCVCGSSNSGTRAYLDFIDVNVDGEKDEEEGVDAADGVALYHAPVWLEVLRRSHPFLSRNACAGGGFAAAAAAAAIAADCAAAAAGPPCRALPCTTTPAVLAHLGLSPSLPLQLRQPPAGVPATDRAVSAGGEVCVLPPSTAAVTTAPSAAVEAEAETLDGLEWAEDVAP